MKKALYNADFEIMGYVDENLDMIMDDSFVPGPDDEFYSPEEIEWQRSEKAKADEQNRIKKVNAEYRQYLADTDWYIVRLNETQKAVPEDILLKRQEARDSII